MQLPFNPKLFFVAAILFFTVTVSAQSSFSYNCTKDTAIYCGPRCITLTTQLPNTRAFSDSYVVNKICYREYVSPAAPGTSGNFVNDDIYSSAVPLPFDFPFYGIYYDQLVIGGNGMVSFDPTLDRRFNNWVISGNLPSSNYDRAVIMAPFHDMNMGSNTSPDRQVKYEVIGVAPHRQWILSFYKVPLFNCGAATQNTHQLVLHEGTGIIEVFINSMEICSEWNRGKAIIGMQNYNRDKAIMAPGRTATGPNWGSVNMNEGWRFTPASGAPLFRKAALYTIDGTFVANGDTVDAGNGNYNVHFNNVCIDSSARYIIKAAYHFESPFQSPAADSTLFSTDTLLVVRNPPLVPQVTVINTNCSNGGSVTVTSPVGPSYIYSLDNAVFQPATVFNNVPPGVHILTVSDINTGCNFSITVTVDSSLQQPATIQYSRNTYCYTETGVPVPVITGATGGTFTASPQGLLIDSSSGAITVAGSDTNFYTVTFHPDNISQCAANTIIRIVDDSRFIWTGAVDSDWENAGNWSCNNIPTSASNVAIYEGSVVINSNVTVKSFTAGPGTSVTITTGGSLTVIDP